MKRALLILYSFIIYFICQAQDIESTYVKDFNSNFWNKQINDHSYVYADVAYIRQHPDIKSQLIDSLKHGHAVQIVSVPYNPTTVKGFEAPWQKVNFQHQGNQKEGYIWLGLLALNSSKDANGNLFIHGIQRKIAALEDKPDNYILDIKCLNKELSLIAKGTYPTELNDQSYTDYKILNNLGLEGLHTIHRIGFMGEACGVSTNHYYFGWNGEKFFNLPYKTSVGDSGVFYHEEKILFPSEHKLEPNLIIKDIEEGIAEDELASELKFNIKKNREKYIWDGNSFSKQK